MNTEHAHPAMRRAWVQTAGLPVDEGHRLVRSTFDTTMDVEWIGNGAVKLHKDGRQMGILQFQGPEAARLDDDMEAMLAKALAGLPVAPEPNAAAGDTIIRELNMSDPVDREMARLALAGVDKPGVAIVADRAELPPIDLPDFDRPAADPEPMRRPARPLVHSRFFLALLWTLLVAFIAAALVHDYGVFTHG